MLDQISNKYFLNKGLYDNKCIFENTKESIRDAIKMQMGLYLTVRETKDHTLIVYEDSNLSRLQNIKDKISDMTYDDLNYVSFYHIPTLKEILDLIKGKVDIILELKIKPNNKEIYEILKEYNGKYLLVSSPKIIRKINKQKLYVGEIISKHRKFSLATFFIKTDFYSYDLEDYDIVKLKKLKEDNKPIIGYKIDNQLKYEKYKDEFDYIVYDNYQNIKINEKIGD